MDPISPLEPEAGGTGDPPETQRRRATPIVPIVATSAFAALAALGATIGIDGRLDPLGDGHTAELQLAMTPRGMGGGSVLAGGHVGPHDIRASSAAAAGRASGRVAATAPAVRLGPVLRLATHVPPAVEKATEKVRTDGASTTGVVFGTAIFDGRPGDVSQGPDGPGLPPPVNEDPGVLRTTIAAVGDLARDGVGTAADAAIAQSNARVEVDLVTSLEPSDFGSLAANATVAAVSDGSQALSATGSLDGGELSAGIHGDGLDEPISDLMGDGFGNDMASLGGDVGDALDDLGAGLESAGLDLGDALGDLGDPLGEFGGGLGELGEGLDGLGDLPSDLGGAVGVVTDTVGDLL